MLQGYDLFEVLVPVVALCITAATYYTSKFIHAKTNNTWLAGILSRLNEAVWYEVSAAEQVAVKGIKAAKDPSSDGGKRVTKAEGISIKKDVIARIKENIGMKGLKKLAKITGVGEQGVDRMIDSRVEAIVGSQNPQ